MNDRKATGTAATRQLAKVFDAMVKGLIETLGGGLQPRPIPVRAGTRRR